jgi:branched-chain amino acid transport system permease protein
VRTDFSSTQFAVPPAHRGLHGFLGVHPGLVGVALVIALAPLYTDRYWIFNVTVGLVLAISCLGLLVLVGWAREISLAQAGLTGSALYLSLYLYGDWPDEGRWPFPLAAAAGIAFAVAVSLVTALVARRLAAAYVLVLTLAVQFLLENSIFLNEHLSSVCHHGCPRVEFFGNPMRADERFFYLVLGCLAVTVVFLHRARNSRFGR